MVSRRALLAGASAVGVLVSTPKVFGKAVQRVTKVNFAVPPGACDCHTHIHGDPRVFPWYAGRVYTPEMALPADLAAVHKPLGIRRVLIVTPSVYGTDNT